jgi:hypothetical protein
MARVVVGLALLIHVSALDAGGGTDPAPLDAPQTADSAADQPLAESSDWPIGGALGSTLFCIEGYESQHGLNMFNRSSGAAGWLQWLHSTAVQWHVSVGNRQSEWDAAARIAARGRALFVSQWVPLQRGLC